MTVSRYLVGTAIIALLPMAIVPASQDWAQVQLCRSWGVGAAACTFDCPVGRHVFVDGFTDGEVSVVTAVRAAAGCEEPVVVDLFHFTDGAFCQHVAQAHAVGCRAVFYNLAGPAAGFCHAEGNGFVEARCWRYA